jgi:hypothetical protein
MTQLSCMGAEIWASMTGRWFIGGLATNSWEKERKILEDEVTLERRKRGWAVESVTLKLYKR